LRLKTHMSLWKKLCLKSGVLGMCFVIIRDEMSIKLRMQKCI
jgi:hypothetical protein